MNRTLTDRGPVLGNALRLERDRGHEMHQRDFPCVPVRKTGDKVTLDACTGWVRPRGRFYENRFYAFALDAPVPKGAGEVLPLEQNKQPLLKRSDQPLSRSIHLEGKPADTICCGRFSALPGNVNCAGENNGLRMQAPLRPVFI